MPGLLPLWLGLDLLLLVLDVTDGIPLQEISPDKLKIKMKQLSSYSVVVVMFLSQNINTEYIVQYCAWGT
jgi:hypothetical protein